MAMGHNGKNNSRQVLKANEAVLLLLLCLILLSFNCTEKTKDKAFFVNGFSNGADNCNHNQ